MRECRVPQNNRLNIKNMALAYNDWPIEARTTVSSGVIWKDILDIHSDGEGSYSYVDVRGLASDIDTQNMLHEGSVGRGETERSQLRWPRSCGPLQGRLYSKGSSCLGVTENHDPDRLCGLVWYHSTSILTGYRTGEKLIAQFDGRKMESGLEAGTLRMPRASTLPVGSQWLTCTSISPLVTRFD